MSQGRLLDDAGATLSDDGVYRYTLTRRWGDPSTVCWVALNPSTADADLDDQTVTKMIGFSQRWGYGGLTLVNLFALRSAEPKALLTHSDPVGPGNMPALVGALVRAQLVVVAWGAFVDHLPRREPMSTVLREAGVKCLGKTKGGHPRHPCRLGYDTPLEPWP